MTIEDFLRPFNTIWEWMRSYTMNFCGYEFTWMDIFIWSTIAMIVVRFIGKVSDP